MNELIKMQLKGKVLREINLKANTLLLDMLKVLNNNNANDSKYELLKMSLKNYDYIDLLMLDIFLEEFYLNSVIDEDLTDNKRIPNGSDNSYGRFFESFILSIVKKHYELKINDISNADGVFMANNKEIILEVKCSKTNTTKQVDRYVENLGIDDFITINGHKNSIDINHLNISRITRNIFKDTFKKSEKRGVI